MLSIYTALHVLLKVVANQIALSQNPAQIWLAEILVADVWKRWVLRPVPNVRPLRVLFGDTNSLSQSSSIVEILRFEWSQSQESKNFRLPKFWLQTFFIGEGWDWCQTFGLSKCSLGIPVFLCNSHWLRRFWPFVAFPSRRLAGFSRTSGSLTFLAITRRLLIAAPWGLEPGKELKQTSPIRPILEGCGNSTLDPFSGSHRCLSRTILSSRQNRRWDTAICLRWEELVSLASQRNFSSVYGMPRVVVLIFWPTARKIGLPPSSLFWGWTSFKITFPLIDHDLFFSRTGTENSIHTPGASRWCCKAHGASGDHLKFGDYGNGERQLCEISSWSGTRRQGETLTHWQEARRLLQLRSSTHWDTHPFSTAPTDLFLVSKFAKISANPAYSFES